MATPLPSVYLQKRLPFRPSNSDLIYAYKTINRYVFDNQLIRPKLIQGTLRKAWGWCEGNDVMFRNGSFCQIRLMDKWFTPQWFMNTLAHEMAHQYQWDIEGPAREELGQEAIMSHGPSFFAWRDRFEYYGLNLKTAHRMRKWFRYQDFRKC